MNSTALNTIDSRSVTDDVSARRWRRLQSDNRFELRDRSRRRGILLPEILVAAILLSAVLALLVPAMYGMRQQRQAMRFESCAIIELNNIDTRIPESLSPGDVSEYRQSLRLSEWFTEHYRDAVLDIESVHSPPESESAADTAPGSEIDRSMTALRFTLRRSRSALRDVPDHKVSLVMWRAVKKDAP